MKQKRRPIYRGDIFYIQPIKTNGHEQQGRRPGIIVSNTSANKYSPIVTVVYLTRQQRKRPLPTHVPIVSTPRQPSIALCEQLDTVDIKRLNQWVGMVTDEEMAKIEKALLIQLSINPTSACERKVDQTPQISIDVLHQKLRIYSDTNEITFPLETGLKLLQSAEFDRTCYQTMLQELQAPLYETIRMDTSILARLFSLFKQVVETEQKRRPHDNLLLQAIFRKTMSVWGHLNKKYDAKSWKERS